DRGLQVGDRPAQGKCADLEEGARRRRHFLDRGRRSETGRLEVQLFPIHENYRRSRGWGCQMTLRPFGPPPHKWERSLSVLDSGDGQAVADRDHDALQPGMLRDEWVVRRDIPRLLVLRCNDLALAQSVVGHQNGTTLEAFDAELQHAPRDLL